MDYGSQYADKRQRVIERRLQQVYRDAAKELETKFNAFLEEHRKKGAEMWKKLQNGEISQSAYSSWMREQVMIGKIWQRKVDAATETMESANGKALTIIRGEQMNVFAENANHEAFQIEKDTKSAVSFDIYDTATADRLIREEPELLPRRVLNGKKDRAWNQGVIARAVTQAVIQGESIPTLAARLAHDTANTNMKAMVRYARTAMTGAQNAGRIETMHRAQDMGIKIRKQWLATLDSRTRDAHQRLDGQVAEIDKPFKSDLGEIMYPGDPTAEPGNVYNCRCTLVNVYPEFKGEKVVRRDNETGEVIQDMTYEQWKKAKGKELYHSKLTEQMRKLGMHQKMGEGERKIIPQAIYNKLIKKATKEGAEIHRGEEWIPEYLEKRGATASTMGNIVVLRKDATITEVLEELYHFRQNKDQLNDDKDLNLRKILNEIDAQKYLISVAERFKIPVEEREETERLLIFYEGELQKLEGTE